MGRIQKPRLHEDKSHSSTICNSMLYFHVVVRKIGFYHTKNIGQGTKKHEEPVSMCVL